MVISKKKIIKGTTWTVIKSKQPMLDGREVDGICHKDTNQLELKRFNDPEKQWSAFVHEYLHACIKELNIDLDEQIEEILILGLEQILIADLLKYKKPSK